MANRPAYATPKMADSVSTTKAKGKIDMELYFLRHGEADWPNWDKPDDERPLTKRGKEEMKKVAAFLCRIGVPLDQIVTSPLPRAEQTARIVAKELDIDLQEDPGLEPGFGLSE